MPLFDDNDYNMMSLKDFERTIQRMSLNEREKLYLEAKDAYYKGDSIMSDVQFDKLENFLKSESSKVTSKVGGTDAAKSKLIHKHLSPMLSLSKVQVNDEDAFLNDQPSSFADEAGRMPLNEINDFFSGSYPLEATPKLDGSAIELQYKNGKLNKVITRGEGGLGADITSKFGPGLIEVPLTMPDDYNQLPCDIEVRGECVMPLDKFENKWKDKGDGTGYKNARNMVAGVLSRDEITEQVSDIHFVAYSLKVHESSNTFYPANTMDTLESMGFHCDIPVVVVKDMQSIKDAYLKIKQWRTTALYQLDGIVFKMPESKRTSLGETRHHPRWAVAVKFPSNESTTTIKSIEWTVGYTGELAPTAILEPVELDNTTVERASLYNVNSIIDKGTMPGAVVSIRKAGEIIPQIVSVLSAMPKPSIADVVPACCPACSSSLEIKQDTKSGAIHVYCSNDNCIAKLSRRLYSGVSALKIMGIGESTCQSLIKAGIKHIVDLFDKDICNIRTLINSGEFKQGRQLDLLLAAISEPRQLELKQVIQALAYEGVGNTMSEQLAKYFAGIDHSFDGLEKAKYEPFFTNTSQQCVSMKSLQMVLESQGCIINMPKAQSAGSIIFEMTGSPAAPFKTKDDFVRTVALKGWVHGKISKATVLITDSMTSSSGKMKDAAKKGLRVMTYDDVVNELGI